MLRILATLIFLVNTLTALAPMTHQDIIEISKPQIVQFSPSGEKIAYVTRRGVLDLNRNVDTLIVNTIVDNSETVALQSAKIVQILWNSRSSSLYILSYEDNLYRVSVCTPQGAKTLFEERDLIGTISISPDDSRIYFTVAKRTSEEEIKKNKEEGFVFDWPRDFIPDLLNMTCERREREEVWEFDICSHEKRLLTSLPTKNWKLTEGLIRRMEVSNNGKYLLLSVQRIGDPSIGESGFSNDVAVWDIDRNEWVLPVLAASRGRFAPAWISDNAFVYHVYSTEPSLGGLRLFDLSLMKENVLECLPSDFFFFNFFWDKKNQLLYGLTNDKLFCIDVKKDTAEQVNLPCADVTVASFDLEAKHFAYVSQSSNVPPEIVYLDFETKQTKRLTTLNPQLKSISHAFVEPINEITSNGLPINGYLVHPLNKESESSHPIIIATYNFVGNYVADAEWHTSFPAQSLAAEGYFILLLNHYGESQDLCGDFQKAQELTGWNKLTIFEEAIDIVCKKGGDQGRVGIYGWSHGAFTVNFLITHSNKFHVACLGEGGDYNIANFWMAEHWQRIYDNTFGGPPWGPTLSNYVNFSPIFQVDKVKAPLLLEFAEENRLQGLEMFTSLRYLGVPSELVIYANEEHNFVHPKARYASMGRKTDWFNFWLLGKKDPSPDKKEQYERWEAMKANSK